LGLIGRNGSGKSTLLQLVCGTLQPSTGTLEVRGRVAALLELGAGFIADFTGRENVWLAASILGLKDREIAARFEAIAAFAGIGDYMDQPVKHYSSGMYARLAFAVCAHVDADILVIDEVLAVGDAAFAQKCMRFLREFRRRGTLLFVSHDIGAVMNLCDRVIWLERGRVRGEGPARELCQAYLATMSGLSSEDSEGFRIGGRGYGEAPQQPARDARWDGASRIELFDFDPDAPWHGHGGATIDAAGFYRDGQPLHAAAGGEEVELRIAGRADRLVASPIIGFLIRDRLGQILFGDNTFLAHRAEPPPLQAGQSFEARFTFTLPYLAEGEYSVAPSIIEGTQAEHIHVHWIENAIWLRAVASPIRRGLVAVPMLEIALSSD
jgi:lipopolysaccharide transport system ATP-binding protein